MSTSDLHPEFDDELLSAYLDNELAPDERAHVEKWLADDPAARQLLEQLRSVSSAVHNLPREAVGADLRDVILQRAERAMLTSKAAAPAAGDNGAALPASLRDALGGYSVGRTRRGWIWAGAAIAAGLLVAAFQWAPERNNAPGEVAMNKPTAMRAPADVELQRRFESTVDDVSSKESKLADEPPVVAAKMPEPPASGRLGGAGGGGEVANGGALAITDGSVPGQNQAVDSYALTPNKSASQDFDAAAGARDRKLAVEAGQKIEPLASSSVATSAPAPNAAPALNDSLAASGMQQQAGRNLNGDFAGGSSDLLVVHLTCSPEALRNDAFTDTLKQNGIELEKSENEALKDKSSLAVQTPSEQGKPAAESVQKNLDVRSDAESSDEPEVVVVEAPPLQVFRCLDAIDKDKQNYPGVAIDTRLVGANTNVAEESRRRGRGIVPQQNRVELTPENVVNVQNSRGRMELNRNADASGVYAKRQVQEKAQQNDFEPNFAYQSNQARAWHIQPQEVLSRAASGKLLNELSKSKIAANAERDTQLGYVYRSSDQKLDANKTDADGNLQVLFMLWPTDQPPSSPAVNDKVSK